MRAIRVVVAIPLILGTAGLEAQTEWTKYAGNPVLEEGATATWDMIGVRYPSVIFDPSQSEYAMWYGGIGATDFAIGRATSPDGVDWTKDASNPVLEAGDPGDWDALIESNSSVLYNEVTDMYEMWYVGISDFWRIGYASSSDGVSWMKHSGNPVLDLGDQGSWDGAGVLGHFVRFDGTTYHMWYTGDQDGTILQIGYAASSDGLSWTKYSGNPVLKPSSATAWDDVHVAHPYVIFDGAIYHMWYSGYDGMLIRIGYATSPDGVDWTKYSGNPVLSEGDQGSWDALLFASASVLFDGSQFHMWYNGSAGTTLQIGYASSPPTAVETKDDLSTNPSSYFLHPNHPNPFNPATSLRYDLPERTDVTLTIYDILGRPVRTLAQGLEEPGQKSVMWDGTDDRGQSVGAGVYLYQIKAGDPSAGEGRVFTHTRKMILLR